MNRYFTEKRKYFQCKMNAWTQSYMFCLLSHIRSRFISDFQARHKKELRSCKLPDVHVKLMCPVFNVLWAYIMQGQQYWNNTVIVMVSHIKAIHTSISLLRIVYHVYIMEMCVLYIVYNCLSFIVYCANVYIVVYVYCTFFISCYLYCHGTESCCT